MFTHGLFFQTLLQLVNHIFHNNFSLPLNFVVCLSQFSPPRRARVTPPGEIAFPPRTIKITLLWNGKWSHLIITNGLSESSSFWGSMGQWKKISENRRKKKRRKNNNKKWLTLCRVKWGEGFGYKPLREVIYRLALLHNHRCGHIRNEIW